ncbi:MAG: MotA/TolQ/ExbB proton channel family protein [Phycisphaerales bacterium]|nr:MotA/TolQ/ExbB proton channel family protein [Phycisphaerales bacterium]
MKILSSAISILCLAITCHAQQPDAGQTMSTLSTSAERELAASIEELNKLRDQIANEKLPLAQELTALEETLSQLRRDHERITRLVDAGNLEITKIKTDTQIGRDQLTYIGNLLDEYARNFESKLNISELQYYGQAIESAKQATENTTLTMEEKFNRQVDFAKVSINRLFDVIGGMRFAGVAVDMEGAVAEGQFAIVGPVALFRANSGAEAAAGIAIPQSGSTKPLIRPLEGVMQAGIASLVANGEGLLPLDPSRGGALKALVQKTNLIHIFKKGGPIMWPLLFASVLALGTVLERILFLMREKWRRDPKAVDAFFAAVSKGDTGAAIGIGKKSKFYVVRALGYALVHKEQSLPSALLYAQAQELKRYRRGIPILDTVITLAPLLGLLGTVTGMMGSFSLIGGELSAPGAITGGIAEALIATAFGLGIAITALVPFNLLNTRMEEARMEIDSAATQLELLVHPKSDAPVASRARETTSLPAASSERSADPASDLDAQRKLQEELARRRRALQRRIVELQVELDDVDMENLMAREPVKE